MAILSFLSGVMSGAANQTVSTGTSSSMPPPADKTGIKTTVAATNVLVANRQPIIPQPGFGPSKILPLCPHNDRGDTSAADLAEHIGNAEWGSAIRDAAETDTGQRVIEIAQDVLKTIGDEALKVGD